VVRAEERGVQDKVTTLDRGGLYGKPDGRRVLYDADGTADRKLHLLHVSIEPGHIQDPDQRPTETHKLQVHSQHG